MGSIGSLLKLGQQKALSMRQQSGMPMSSGTTMPGMIKPPELPAQEMWKQRAPEKHWQRPVQPNPVGRPRGGIMASHALTRARGA